MGATNGERGCFANFWRCWWRHHNATVLAPRILREGMKSVTAAWTQWIWSAVSTKQWPLQVWRRKDVFPCDDIKPIAQSGTISANSDKFSSVTIIAERQWKSRKEGVITVEEMVVVFDNELDPSLNGMQFDRGLPVTLLVNEQQRNVSPTGMTHTFLLYDKKSLTFVNCCHIGSGLPKSSRPLLMVSEDVERRSVSHFGC